MAKPIDRLSDIDYQIFALAAKDVNVFTDWYFRAPDSGTRYNKDNADNRYVKVWHELYDRWKDDPVVGKKDKWIFQGVKYNVIYDADGNPIFWHHHGFLFQDWQKKAFHAPQPEQTIIGGFGSGKTAYIAISLAVMAALFPGFRGFAVAPQMIQASEVYKFLDRVTYNTPWFNRWVHRSTEHQKPGFTLMNDFIGKSEITILSIEDDPEKVRTVEGDVVFLDQAEKIQQLDGVIRDLGTRTRGMVNGRPRIGRLALIANSDNNPELWYRYDLGLLQPDNYLSLTVKSKDNHALSPTDIASFKRRVGGDAATEKQWMDGERPVGSGEHFTAEMITRCTDRSLNATMDSILEQRQTLPSGAKELHWMSQFVKEEAARCGIYHWEMPPDLFNNYKAQYIVIADPGSGNPPFRNSACIMAWDITHFPQKPAILRAFHWVHGNGEYSPFINEFKRMVEIYHAQGSCAFDSTGIQKSFNELVFENETLSTDEKLMAEGMDMNGPNGKYTSLNALKLFMSRGMIKFPYLGAINLQLSNYQLPDGDIPQDIVMTMAMSAQYIRQYYYHEKENDDIVKNQIHKLAPNSYRVNRSPRRPVDRYSKI